MFVRNKMTRHRYKRVFCNRPDNAIKFEPEETITGQKLQNIPICIYIGSCKYKLS